MSDLGWQADGIERAEVSGGVTLERYYRPGFTGGPSVRIAGREGGSGQYIGDPTYWDDYETRGRARQPDKHRPSPR